MRASFFSRLSGSSLIWSALLLLASNAGANFNARTEALARLLTPSPIRDNGTAADLEGVKTRLAPILSVLEQNSRTNGPNPESLLENAYELRKDLGHVEKIVTSAVILQAWRDASAMGLFNDAGGMGSFITKGRGQGESPVFEHIVPPSSYPKASAHLANVRIVDPGRKRTEGAELTRQEQAHFGQLEKIVAERTSVRELAKISNPEALNRLGQTKEQEEARWKKSVEDAGEAFKNKPNIILKGRASASPSHLSKGCWEVTAEVTNLSRHPTEIELSYSLLGITDKKRDHYRMMDGSHKLKLLPGEARELVLKTRAEGSYKAAADKHDGLSKAEAARSKVRYRGFVLQISHGKDRLTHAVTDRGLLEYTESDTAVGRLAAF